MKPQTGTSLSLWAGTSDVPKFPQLNSDIDAEICIVGGGITGLTAGYLLAKEGRQVTIIDDGDIGSGESSRTSGNLLNVLMDPFRTRKNSNGKKKASRPVKTNFDPII